MKVSELIAKPIISIFDAKIVGTIGNIYFDSKMTKGVILSLFDDDASEPEEKFIELAKIVSLESDAAVIKDSSYVTYGWNTRLAAVNPINSPAFTQDGKLLGTVRDIVMDGIKVVSFIVDSREISAQTLLSHSVNALVFNDSGKPIKPPPKKKMPKAKEPQKIELHYTEGKNRQTEIDKSVLASDIANKKNTIKTTEKSVLPQIVIAQNENNILSTANRQDEKEESQKIINVPPEKIESKNVGVQSEKDYANTPSVTFAKQESLANKEQLSDNTETVKNEDLSPVGIPHKIPPSFTNVSKTPPESDVDNKFDFLLNKRVDENIYADDGTILIRSNTLITREVIAICKTYSRLVQLALHSSSQN